MEHVLTMTFLTENGEKSNFSISGVKPTLTGGEINSLMDTIIAKNVFITKSGALTKKSGANMTQKSVTKFDIV